jgi:hypothetical protein
MKPGEMVRQDVCGKAQAGRRPADGGVRLSVCVDLVSHCFAMNWCSMTYCTTV